MYLPDHFKEDSNEEIQYLIEQFPFATLVTNTPDGLTANHLPILTDADGQLLGHIALNNNLHRDLTDGDDVLVIFKGEDTYVSPNWYPTKKIHHEHVPTWNYQVVHVHGKISFQHDDKSKRAIVGRLTKHFERLINGAEAWKMSDAPREYMQKMIENIVAFNINPHKIIAKSKLGQNKEIVDFNNLMRILGCNGNEELSKRMSKITT